MKEKITIKNYYIVYTAILYVVHAFLPLNWADDSVFATYKNYGSFIAKSARPIVDTFTFYFAKYHFFGVSQIR